MRISDESHPNLYLEDRKIQYQGKTQEDGVFVHQWCEFTLLPGGRDLSIRLESDPLIIDRIELSARPSDRETCLMDFAFDHYQRYQLVSEIIDAISCKRLSVLDVGGARGMLSLFAPQHEVTQLDLVWEDTPGAVKYDGGAFPYKDRSFDIVVAADTLEHVPKERREALLDELIRVSDQAVVLCGPYDEPNVCDAENVIRTFIGAQLGRTDRFLEEHALYGLPDRQTVRRYLARTGMTVTEIPNGYLSRWLSMQLASYALGVAPELEEGKARFNAIYNSNYYRSDNRFPSYRIAAVATRTKPSSELERALHNLIGADGKHEDFVMWNVASLIVGISNYGLIREKETTAGKQIERIGALLDHSRHLEHDLRELLSHITNLESEIKEEGALRKKLVEHTDNIDEILGKQKNHFESVEGHIKNLDTLLFEQQKHTSNSHTLNEELQKQFRGLQDHIKNLDKQIAERDETYAQSHKHIQNLDQHNQNRDQFLASLQDHLQNLDTRDNELQERLAQIQQHADNLSTIIQEKDSALENTLQHASNLEAIISELKTHIQQLDTHNKNLETNRQEQAKMQADLLSSSQTHGKNLETLLSHSQAHANNLEDQLRNQNENWRVQLAASQDHANNLEHLLSDLNERLAGQQAHAKNLETMLQEKEQQYQKVHESLTETQSKLDTVNTENQFLRETLKQMTPKMNQLAGEMEQITAGANKFDLRSAETFSPEIADLLEALNQGIHRLNTKRKQWDQACASMESSFGYKLFAHLGWIPRLEEPAD